MNRRLWIVLAAVAVAAVAGFVSLSERTAESPPGPVRVPHSDLPKSVCERGEHRGQLVTVSFPLAPTPTTDPLVWEYRPGWPAGLVPASYRIHFAEPPRFATRPPHAVTGTVEGIDPDTVQRVNGVPGVLVLRNARAWP